MKAARILFICLSVLLIPVVSHAFGAINIRLLSEPISAGAGIDVTLETAFQKPMRNATGQTGQAWFFELPPGDYTVSLTPEEGRPRLRIPVSLGINAVIIVDVLCSACDDADRVCIRREKLPDSPAVVTASEIDWLPEGSNLTGLFRSVPWSFGEQTHHVLGGSPNDLGLIIDGMDLSDPAGRVWIPGYSVQSFDQMLLHGVALPIGDAPDRTSILEITPRQPSQRLHLFARFNQSHGELLNLPGSTRLIPGGDGIESEAALDGPVWSDRIWFMGSFRGLARALPDPKNVSPQDNWGQHEAAVTGNALTGQLLFRLFDEQRVRIMYGLEGYRYDDIVPTDSSSPDATTDSLVERPFGLVRWSWRMSPRWSFGVMAGRLLYRDESTPRTRSLSDPGDASFRDMRTDRYYNNGADWMEDERRRMMASFRIHYSNDDLAGVHRLTLGAGWQRDRRRIDESAAGGAWYEFSETDAFRERLPDESAVRLRGDFIHFHLEDKWYILDHVLLEAGVQYNRSIYYDSRGDSAYPGWKWGAFRADDYRNEDGGYRWTSQLKFDTMWAPRVGFKWDIFKDNCAVITASFSRYYDPLDLTFPRDVEARAGERRIRERYTGPGWTDADQNGIPDEPHFFASENWSPASGDDEATTLLIDTELAPPSTDEVAVEYRHDWKNGVRLSTGMIVREASQMIEDVGLFGDADGNIVWTYRGAVDAESNEIRAGKPYDPCVGDYARRYAFVTNLDGSQRRYYGFHIKAAYEGRRVKLLGGYVLSNTVGEVVGVDPETGDPAYLTSAFDSVTSSRNRWGDLPWSAHHHLSASAWILAFDHRWFECRLGIAGYWRSGFASTAWQSPPPTYDPDNELNDIEDPDTWTGVPSDASNATIWYPDGRGNRRLDPIVNVDLSVRNSFDLGPSSRLGRLTLQLDVMNATNNRTYRETIEGGEWTSDEAAHREASTRWYRLGVSYSF